MDNGNYVNQHLEIWIDGIGQEIKVFKHNY